MCGIFGFSGYSGAAPYLLRGLKRLEYRGYDSWGISILTDGKISTDKQIGHLPEVESYLADSKLITAPVGQVGMSSSRMLGIAHTRWATHGGVTQVNAHPHSSVDGSFVLAQNGIVENYQELKQQLADLGHKFHSQTDTEVIVRLIEQELKDATDGGPHSDSDANFSSSEDNGSASDVVPETSSLFDAVGRAFSKLEGRNTIIVLATSGEIIAIRNGSPLVAGERQLADKKEYFIGSDYLSFADQTNHILELANFEGVYVHGEKIEKITVSQDKKGEMSLEPAEFHSVAHEDMDIDKGGFPDFMLKEIHEQADTIAGATAYTLEELMPLIDAMKQARTVYTVGCGTAAYAAGQIAYYLRKLASVKALELKGYEMDSYKNLFQKDDLLLAISQSGETADTIEAVEFMKSAGGKVASIVNMIGSSLTKISDYPYLSRTGAEICVASTKAFTAQISWGFLLASSLNGKYSEAKSELKRTSASIRELLGENVTGSSSGVEVNNDLEKKIAQVVDYMKGHEHAFVLGRGQNFYIALEGALKVKEITYKHFEGFAAGELKHGVIALIDKGTPVFAIISNDETSSDMLSSVAEVKARGGMIIAISPKNNELFDIWIQTPELAHTSPLVNVIPFQLLSHHLGVALGNNVDKPRNLAKSVTVK